MKSRSSHRADHIELIKRTLQLWLTPKPDGASKSDQTGSCIGWSAALIAARLRGGEVKIDRSDRAVQRYIAALKRQHPGLVTRGRGNLPDRFGRRRPGSGRPRAKVSWAIAWREALAVTGMTPSALREKLLQIDGLCERVKSRSTYYLDLKRLGEDLTRLRRDLKQGPTLRLHQVLLRFHGDRWVLLLLGLDMSCQCVSAVMLQLPGLCTGADHGEAGVEPALRADRDDDGRWEVGIALRKHRTLIQPSIECFEWFAGAVARGTGIPIARVELPTAPISRLLLDRELAGTDSTREFRVPKDPPSARLAYGLSVNLSMTSFREQLSQGLKEYNRDARLPVCLIRATVTEVAVAGKST